MTTTPAFVFLQPGHRVRVVPEQAVLDEDLVWAVSVVAASPIRESPEYDDLLDETFGSSCDWTDEFRFDNESRELRSLVFSVPERAADPAVVDEWSASPEIAGGLVPETIDAFDVEIADHRALGGDGRTLVCTLGRPSGAPRWRLRLAPDLALLFEGDRYVGWALSNPLEKLAPWSLQSRHEEAPAGTLEAVCELHEILTPEGIAALTNGEAAARERLRQLASTMESLPRGPQRDVLLARARNLLQTFGA